MTLKVALALASSMTLTACASAQEVEQEFTLEGYSRTGETQSCLSLRQIDQIDPVDDTHWIFETRTGDKYLNEVSRGCRRADGLGTYIHYETTGASLCRNDIVEVRDRGTNDLVGSCSLGDYEELSPIEEDDHS